jgi:predicted aspartyl protease
MPPLWHFLLLLLCLTKCSTAIAGDPSTDFDIHYKVFYGSLILVPMMVNGFGPYDFVLDTGTSATIIDSKLAAQLSLPLLGRTTQFAVQGSAQAPIARVNDLELGSAEVLNLAVFVESIAGVDHFGGNIRGVLGEDFLGRFDFLLDNRHHQVHLEEGVVAHSLVDDLEGERIPFLDPTSNRLLLSAKAPEVGPNELTFALDSGASTIVLFSNAHTRAWLLPRQDNGTSAMSSSLHTNARSIDLHRLRTLTLGQKVFANLEAAIPVSSPAQDSDGLLPTGIFRSIYISHSGRFAIFDPVVRNNRNTVRKK